MIKGNPDFGDTFSFDAVFRIVLFLVRRDQEPVNGSAHYYDRAGTAHS